MLNVRAAMGKIMSPRFSSSCILVSGLVVGLFLPMRAEAARVGYADKSTSAFGVPETIASLGHTPVDAARLDAASLAGLDALVLVTCTPDYVFSVPNEAINNAVYNGMTLLLETSCGGGGARASVNTLNLPGSPTFGTSALIGYYDREDLEFPEGSPAATGPGGNLSATSLDNFSGPSFYPFPLQHNYPRSALPPGATVLLTTANPDHVAAFAWNYGAGRVIFTDTAASWLLPGSLLSHFAYLYPPGSVPYFKNLVSWAAGPAASCASEGYKGTQLTWCKNICESGLTGSALETWIQRWTRRYHNLPYCAVEDGSK